MTYTSDRWLVVLVTPLTKRCFNFFLKRSVMQISVNQISGRWFVMGGVNDTAGHWWAV
jgi:hypothetical protein